MKKENTSTRLKKVMSDRNLKQVDILNATTPYCKMYDVKMNKSDLSQYVSGKVEPNQEKLFVLSSALNVNVAWLMGFDVPMERHIPSAKKDDNYFQTDAERKLILSYRKLNEKNQKKCSIYANTLLTNQQLEEELLPNAAHERTDIEITDEMRQHDDDIMNDDSNWK
nr:MAG TPA: Repressor protein CI [Caudoviricetes sp.]